MNNLSRYIFNWYPNLMTVKERAAYKHLIGLQKAKRANSEKMKNAVKKFWCSSDFETLKMLENGDNQFFEDVTQRILKEPQNEIFLNYCSQCGSLARTPTAKQCPKCFYSWH